MAGVQRRLGRGRRKNARDRLAFAFRVCAHLVGAGREQGPSNQREQRERYYYFIGVRVQAAS